MDFILMTMGHLFSGADLLGVICVQWFFAWLKRIDEIDNT